VAKAKSIYTVSLTGASGGAMKKLADCAICAPSEETPRIQECHILMGHIICEIAEVALFDDSEEIDGHLAATRGEATKVR